MTKSKTHATAPKTAAMRESSAARGALSSDVLGAVMLPDRLKHLAPVPIGAIVGIEVMLFGGIAGAAMNPARAFGPFLALGEWQYFWIYLLGPVAGITAAAVLFCVIFLNRPYFLDRKSIKQSE